MDIVDTKILVACLFGIVRVFFGLLPIKLCKYFKWHDGEVRDGVFVNEKRHKQVHNGLAMFQAFGGGVLFATCFLHMMPEVYETTIELKKYGLINTHYPFSQLIVSVGFFLVYFIEELAQFMVSTVPEKPVVKSINSARTATPSNKIAPGEDGVQTIIDDDPPTPTKSPPTPAFDAEEENAKNLEKDQDVLQIEELDKLMERGFNRQQILRGILIVLALSLHALFEGLAIGLQMKKGNIWYLFIAISIHSATILFVISLELIMANTRVRVIIVHVLILSITSPLGVFLGLLVTLGSNSESRAKSVAVVFLEGLSCGTILYITFFEVLIREKERRQCRMRRALFIILGFCLMACLECGEMYY